MSVSTSTYTSLVEFSHSLALELTASAWGNVANFHAPRAIAARASIIGGSSAGTFARFLDIHAGVNNAP